MAIKERRHNLVQVARELENEKTKDERILAGFFLACVVAAGFLVYIGFQIVSDQLHLF